MNEVFYNIKMTLWFIIILSFVLFRYIKLDWESLFHANDFEWLRSNFEISTWVINTASWNIIFLENNTKIQASVWCIKNTIPVECEWDKKASIKCLAVLKEKWYWFYNWYYFKPSDKNCRL